MHYSVRTDLPPWRRSGRSGSTWSLVITAAIRSGKREPAQRGLWLFRLNLEYQREWDGVRYSVQQVAPIVDEEEHRFVVVTVYTYYF